MTIREDRRAAALDRVADHMLAHGLALSTLRALGQAAGVSDRMLMYYFTDKDDIVLAALATIAARLGGVLADAAPFGTRQPERAVLADLAALCRGNRLRPYIRVWIELVSLASRGEQPYLAAAGQIAEYFIFWVAERLDLDEAHRMPAAARMIALIDGLILLDCVGRGEMADRALRSAIEIS